MKYLLDSDAARKLAQYNLIQELCLSLGCTLKDFCVLPQLKYQLRLNDKAKAIKLLKSEVAFDVITELLQHASEVEITQSPESDAILALDVPGLDSGELTLLAGLLSSEDDKLVTGDKRALFALSTTDIDSRLKNYWLRIICLEDALLIIVHSQNFSEISEKVRAAPHADTAIRNAFGNSAPASREQVIAALNSEISHIERETKGLYVRLYASQPT